MMKLLKVGAALTAMSLAGTTASHAVVTQLGFAIDESGSIFSSDFVLQKDGLAAALANNLPTNGDFEVTVVSFSSGIETVVAPTVIDSAATLQSVVDLITANTQSSGLTNLGGALNTLTSLITGSANFAGASEQIINISTDGVPTTGPDAVSEAIAAFGAGIDIISAEAVGSFDLATLQAVVDPFDMVDDDQVLVELGLGETIPDNQPFIVAVDSFADFGAAIDAKIEVLVGPEPVPAPATLALLGLGLIGVSAARRRR
ncbi:MAG: DUF1194 domain-containing protein [Rhodothalassiaceae bacterium]